MDVLQGLDEARAAIDVLEHPFYRRWSAGELGAGELGFYAGQYRHAVRALADASALAARAADPEHVAGLQAHAREEAAHVELWEGFAEAVQAPAEAPATRQTLECAHAWRAGESLLEHLAVLYAIEAGQPRVSQTKLDGLAQHYGHAEEGPASEYFALHAVRDVEHARQARELIAELWRREGEPPELGERMIARASAALAGNWRLLDGVQERAPRASATV